MGHQHQRGSVLGIEFEQQVDDGATGLGVQVAGGLVGEQKRWPGDEGPRERDPLLLAAGQLARIVLKPLAKAHPLQDLSRACLRAAVAAKLQRQHDVFQRGQRGEQLEALEHEADLLAPDPRAAVLVQGRQDHAIQAHRALAGHIQAGQQGQQRALA